MSSNSVASPNWVLTQDKLCDALEMMSMSTKSVHADDFHSPHRAIAPGIHVAVNYRYARNPDDLVHFQNDDPNAPFDSHIYSRYTAPNSSRFETVLGSLFKAPVVSYSSGLSAFHAALLLLNPKQIFIGDGYHGIHGVINVMSKISGLKKLTLDDLDLVQAGDVIHIETPLNPTGEATNLDFYREKALKSGAYLIVDATFAPPPLQDPLKHGADIVLHSGTKYIGGHSDMLCGILVVNPDRDQDGWVTTLFAERQVIGGVMGSLEGWLGLRSLRTFHLRLMRQSKTAQELVAWLTEGLRDEMSVIHQLVYKVQHASLQEDALREGWLQKQMPGGYGPVFSLLLKDPELAKRLPSRLFIFQHATSLGGVESLMEWRYMSDKNCDKRLLRVSCGVEDTEDMKSDITQAFDALLKLKNTT